MNQRDRDLAIRYFDSLRQTARQLDADPEAGDLDKLTATVRVQATADLLARMDVAGMTREQDIAHQHATMIRERVEIELAHAEIDGTVIHSLQCDEARPECSCGAMQEANARAVELVQQGKATVRLEVADHAFQGDGSPDPTICSCGELVSSHLRH